MGLTMRERQAVTGEYRPRYHTATKKGKQALLDKLVRLTGYRQKSAVRLLAAKPPKATAVYIDGRPVKLKSEKSGPYFWTWRLGEVSNTEEYPHTASMKLIVLGSGTSYGIPVIGCGCLVCRSPDTRDKRMRSSLYLAGEGGEGVVIDTGPEFRLQLVRAGIRRLDAILLTHAHADHLHGLDDIRPLCREHPIPVYTNQATLKELRERFSYVFHETQRGGGKPRLEPLLIPPRLNIGGLAVTPIPVKHGTLDILGWRIDEALPGKRVSAVYLTDTSALPRASRPLANEPDVLIIDGLRMRPHETHFSFEQALRLGAELKARQVYLTHLSHDHSHQEIAAYCQAFRENHSFETALMAPAFDEQEIRLV